MQFSNISCFWLNQIRKVVAQRLTASCSFATITLRVLRTGYQTFFTHNVNILRGIYDDQTKPNH